MKTKAKRPLPRSFKMPWGSGEITEEASYMGKWHEPTIQLMTFENGTTAIRFAHYAHGSFQRSPLIIDTKDLAKLRKVIAKNTELKRLLKSLVK